MPELTRKATQFPVKVYRTKRVIDELRERFPGEWKYVCTYSWRRADGARAHWCVQLDPHDEDMHTSQLYFYPLKGTPVLVRQRGPRSIFKDT